MGRLAAPLNQSTTDALSRSGRTAVATVSGWRRCFVAGLVGVSLSLGSFSSSADIRIEDRDSSSKAGERFSLDVRDEPIAAVMDKLAERFDFEVDGYPEHWSSEPMNFSATGDLERVLRSLLKDTSHVFEYHSFPETNETRIVKLNLLNEGVDGIMVTTPQQQTTLIDDGSVTIPGTGDRRPGSLSDRVSSAASQDLNIDATAASSAGATAPNTTPNAGAAPAAQVSGLSRSLEQRARQSSSTQADAGGSTNATTPAPVDPSAPSPEMRALTQKALQDVRGLAEALRNAENGSQ